jgi:hypothetical protein
MIPASDGHTGEPLWLEVKNNQPVLRSYVTHFAVPASLWWNNIVFYLSDHASLPVGRNGQLLV